MADTPVAGNRLSMNYERHDFSQLFLANLTLRNKTRVLLFTVTRANIEILPCPFSARPSLGVVTSKSPPPLTDYPNDLLMFPVHFSDPPGFRDVAIVPIHANSTIPCEFSETLKFYHFKFDKSLSSPTTTPFRYTKGGNSALRTRCRH